MWRSAPMGTGWSPPAQTTRSDCGTPTPANPSATPHGHTRRGDQCGVQPRRAPAGLRQRRRHGAVVERRHRPTHRRAPHRAHRHGVQCGVQPRRAPAGLRQRRQHGAVVERRHRPTHRRPAADRAPAGRSVWRSAPTGSASSPAATTTTCDCGPLLPAPRICATSSPPTSATDSGTTGSHPPSTTHPSPPAPGCRWQPTVSPDHLNLQPVSAQMRKH